MRKILIFFLVLSISFTHAQELNCTLTVNHDQVPGTNNQVYKTLEKSLNDFVNKTTWTRNGAYEQIEKINCSMVIIINSEVSNQQFSASIQVQSSRPAYNSNYSTPIFNYNDKDFSFNYQEFEQLNFNPDNFDSNLMSVLAYYCYMIIGMDSDTFSMKGGTSSFEMAQQIANYAQASGYKGWKLSDGNANRFVLINDIMSNTFSPFREAMYLYHINGIDLMSSDLKTSKTNIEAAMKTLAKLHAVRPNSFLSRVFFDSKSDEIVSVFSGGPSIPITDLVDILNKMAPTKASKWATIKY
jgi:hypothetical protein